MKGRILNIQKFSIHDGPGIRTTLFVKGCPLECRWCHNPESIGYERDIMVDFEKCSSCGSCTSLCDNDALKMVEVAEGNILVANKSLCIGCGKCETYCINEAISIVGRDMEVDDVIEELLKDRLFYEESGGGVTISGGEPLVQADFITKILKRLKEEGIHTAVDTCGQVPFKNFEKVMEYTDLFLYDIKIGDESKHLEYTGASNKRIIENLKRLSESGAAIKARMIMIDGVNTEDEDIEKIIDILEETDVSEINILPYHNISNHKYRKLGKSYKKDGMAVPSRERLEEIKGMLEEKGYEVAIGG